MSLSQPQSVPTKNHALSAVTPFVLAGFEVEPSALTVRGNGKVTRLESKAMRVLVYLVERAGSVVSREDLEAHIWPGRVVTEDAVTNAIAKLRRALGDQARHPHIIETIPKIGYRLIAEVLPSTEIAEGGNTGAAGQTGPDGRGLKLRVAWKRAITVLSLLSVVLWWLLQSDDFSLRDERTLPDNPSVAVLPFENLGTTPEQDYFAHGITGGLIADLSKVRGLLVIAPGSALQDRQGDPNSTELPVQLNVDYVVMGGVQRLRDRFRVNVHLIEVRDQHAVWGERYDGALEDVFRIQDKLTAEVIAALRIKLGPDERESLARQLTASVAAYDEYLRGIEEHGHRTSEQNRSAMEHFQLAIAIDPTFASAYAGLAMAHSRNAIDGWTQTPSRSLKLALEYAQKAAALDPSIPQVHFAVGQVELFRRQHLAAVEAAQRAIESNPNYADAYTLSAWILNYSGRHQQAMASIQQAMLLNPHPPASYLEVLGEILFAQVRYAESAAVFRQVLDINPNYTRARMWHAAVLALAGDIDGAEWEAIELLVLNPEFSQANLEFAFPFKDARVLNTLLDGLRSANSEM